ncbi:MAG: D-glycero-beta-D-manno-heptose 1,7-bisphosphate 7-phosphatase [Gammaproteobacteria bacterium]
MKLVILDRDGVINQESDAYIKTPAEWTPLPHSLSAIKLLTDAKFTLVVATNQSGIGRGLYDEAMLQRIHNKMLEEVNRCGGSIDNIFYCPHLPDDNCECRKPKPGLLHQVARYYNTSLNGVPFVGDSLRDMQAAIAVGAQPILVKTGHGQQVDSDYIIQHHIREFNDLMAAAKFLVEHYA